MTYSPVIFSLVSYLVLFAVCEIHNRQIMSAIRALRLVSGKFSCQKSKTRLSEEKMHCPAYLYAMCVFLVLFLVRANHIPYILPVFTNIKTISF